MLAVITREARHDDLLFDPQLHVQLYQLSGLTGLPGVAALLIRHRKLDAA